MTSVVICYSSDRKLIHGSMSPEALQLHPSSDRELPPASASSHHYQIPPHGIQVVPPGLLSTVPTPSFWAPSKQAFPVLKSSIHGSNSPLPNSFLLCAYHPQNAFLIALPEIPLKEISFPIPTFLLSSGGHSGPGQNSQEQRLSLPAKRGIRVG